MSAIDNDEASIIISRPDSINLIFYDYHFKNIIS